MTSQHTPSPLVSHRCWQGLALICLIPLLAVATFACAPITQAPDDSPPDMPGNPADCPEISNLVFPEEGATFTWVHNVAPEDESPVDLLINGCSYEGMATSSNTMTTFDLVPGTYRFEARDGNTGDAVFEVEEVIVGVAEIHTIVTAVDSDDVKGLHHLDAVVGVDDPPQGTDRIRFYNLNRHRPTMDIYSFDEPSGSLDVPPELDGPTTLLVDDLAYGSVSSSFEPVWPQLDWIIVDRDVAALYTTDVFDDSFACQNFNNGERLSKIASIILERDGRDSDGSANSLLVYCIYPEDETETSPADRSGSRVKRVWLHSRR